MRDIWVRLPVFVPPAFVPPQCNARLSADCALFCLCHTRRSRRCRRSRTRARSPASAAQRTASSRTSPSSRQRKERAGCWVRARARSRPARRRPRPRLAVPLLPLPLPLLLRPPPLRPVQLRRRPVLLRRALCSTVSRRAPLLAPPRGQRGKDTRRDHRRRPGRQQGLARLPVCAVRVASPILLLFLLWVSLVVRVGHRVSLSRSVCFVHCSVSCVHCMAAVVFV
jgi:hypothetical protein